MACTKDKNGLHVSASVSLVLCISDILPMEAAKYTTISPVKKAKCTLSHLASLICEIYTPFCHTHLRNVYKTNPLDNYLKMNPF